MAVNGYKFTALTGGGAGALDAQDGAGLGEGDIAIVMVSGTLYLYQLSASSGATESSPDVIAPDTNAGTKRWLIQRIPQTNTVPVGSIMAWMGGYFINGSNAGFTSILGNDASTVNALLNASGFYVCNGAALNLAGSSIYNGAGRYLPNLTGDIFLQGDTLAGLTGGSNTDNHTHTTGSFTLTTNEMPNHTHTVALANTNNPSGVQLDSIDNVGKSSVIGVYINTGSTGGGAAHNHGVTGTPSITENRANFLSCFYIQKVL